MKNRLLTLLFVLVLSAAVAVAQTSTTPATNSTPDNQNTSDQMGQTSNTQNSAASADDESLHRQVHEQLATNPAFQNVQVTVKNSVVTLDGTVANKNDKKEAKRLAKAIPGVKNVHEHLKVDANMAASASTTGGVSGTAEKAEQKDKYAVPMTGSADVNATAVGSSENTSEQPSTGTAQPSTPPNAGVSGEASASTLPQQSTGTAAANANAPGTTAATQPSTASGQASTSGEANTGISTTTNPSGTSNTGVSSETNPQTSPTSQQNPDTSAQTSGTMSSAQTGTMSSSNTDQLRSQLETALKNEPTLSSSNVQVDVTDTKITLTGSVATGKDRQTAKRIAQSYAGNRKVVDKMTVTGMGNGANDTSTPPSTTPPPQL